MVLDIEKCEAKCAPGLKIIEELKVAIAIYGTE